MSSVDFKLTCLLQSDFIRSLIPDFPSEEVAVEACCGHVDDKEVVFQHQQSVANCASSSSSSSLQKGDGPPKYRSLRTLATQTMKPLEQPISRYIQTSPIQQVPILPLASNPKFEQQNQNEEEDKQFSQWQQVAAEGIDESDSFLEQLLQLNDQINNE